MRGQSQMIDRIGWPVTPRGDDGRYTHTIGLTAHGYPELLIAGLDPTMLQPHATGRRPDRRMGWTGRPVQPTAWNCSRCSPTPAC
ncbi:DUF4262 domain-containing protein [Micromonospora globbae]|jgi:hypothetical protein|uniref:DUF4262 domain-containing protein n=1 Tax=Micromonospora globbae TaxID=1894969 RepID=A0A420EEM6_9ACTN|nr:DUF4262 domain-containing protein [Micromonospora globbae]